MKLKITMDKNSMKAARKAVSDTMAALTNTRKTTSRLAVVLYQSVQKNFTTQGTDTDKWKRLAPSTIAGRRKGKGGGSAKILMDTGFMRASITPASTDTEASVGLNGDMSRLGAIHQFGVSNAGRNRTTVIPARPFMVLRKEYEERIMEIARGDLFK